MVRRFPIFVLLGPFLVWLTFLLLLVPDLLRKPNGGALAFFGIALLVVAVVGFIPAIVLAWSDHLMAHFGLSRVLRAAICAVLAYPVATLAWWIALGEAGLRSSFADDLYVAGLYGMIPAAVCSWLAGRGVSAAPAAPAAST